MPFDRGLTTSFDPDFPRPGVAQGTQQFRANFRAIGEALANLHRMTESGASAFTVETRVAADGAVKLELALSHNRLTLPQGDPTIEPEAGMIRYRDGEIEVYNGVHWRAVGGRVADCLSRPRTIAVTGSVVGEALFDGTNDIRITTRLTESGVAAGTYGCRQRLPVITVDATGRVIAAETVPLAVPRAIEHRQSIPAPHWVIDHGLDDYPSVTLVSGSGERMDGAVCYPTRQRVTIDFDGERTGIARLL